ncbi:TPA: sulfatase [Vibrio parahaemolyticus]
MSVSRRDVLKGLAATSVAATTAACSSVVGGGTSPLNAQSSEDSKKTKSPNLLILFPDEMRVQALGFMGQDEFTKTPHIDQLASEGVVLSQAISNFPLCTPARGMLMTGQYPYHNGINGNSHTPVEGAYGGSDFGIELKKNALTWSKVMKGLGYNMGYIGKWHLECPRTPIVPSYNNPMENRYWNDDPVEDLHNHGFDFTYAYGTYDLHMNPIYWSNETTRDAPLKINQWSPEHEADIAINYLRNEGGKYRDSDNPFALVVSMNPPHSPYDQVPEKYLERFAGKTSREMNNRPNVNWDKKYPDGYGPQYFKEYLAMVNGVDEQIGRIMTELDSLGLSEDTLVVMFSDHGSCMGSHGKPTKQAIFEEAVRVPMIFRWKGKLQPMQDDLLFSFPDIYPTILGAMGLGEHIPDTVEGTDFTNTLLGEKGDIRPTSQLFMKSPYGVWSYGQRGVRTERYSMTVVRKIGKPLVYKLYDNVNDPYQLKNIANENPEICEKLLNEELMPWIKQTGDSWRPTVVPKSILKSYT